MQATEANPRQVEAWNGLGWSRQNMGMPQSAKEAFQRCLALDPKHPGALNGLGWIAKGERNLPEAIRCWELAVAAAPQATAALAGLAATHLENGRPDLAAKHAEKWLALETGNAEARRILEAARAPSQSAAPPRITSTTPPTGGTEVDPATTEIIVAFDQDMAGGFSWTGGGPDYPELTGGPAWRDARTCVLPVKLEPGRYYRVGINSKSHRNFRGKNGVPTPPSAIYFTTAGASEELKARTQKPVVLEMSPANGAENVDPATTELRVTFSVPMGGGFSWTGGGPEYPPGIEGKGPYWTEDQRTCVLPVKLEPNHAYRLGLNSFSHKNFQSAAGVPLEPVEYSFRAGNAPAAKPPLAPVPFTTGSSFFQPGDSIMIKEVASTSPDFKPGDTLQVKGAYLLASESEANLLLSVTATEQQTSGSMSADQRTRVSKGQGEFTLTASIENQGYLHVSFYSIKEGQPLGGVYFGTARQMREIEDWDLATWYKKQ